ncbi:uncharacterized protein V1518DRAFT_378884 [Limtongia smithiae]|uniref:uncharacterized protein n=1 Tax=Limtongia smithiae TaxID=1125753 RepID=UPI0034CF3668
MSFPADAAWMDSKRMEAVEQVVLHRARIARLTRQLQNRLALASYKTKRGWENLDLDQIEPRIADEVARKHSAAITTKTEGPTSARSAVFLSSPVKLPKLSATSADGSSAAGASGGISGSTTATISSSRKAHKSSLSSSTRKRARTMSHENKSALPHYTPWRSGHDDDDFFADSSPHQFQVPMHIRLSQSSPVYPGISMPVAHYPPFSSSAHQQTPGTLPPTPNRHMNLQATPTLAHPSLAQPLQRINGSPAKSRSQKTPNQNGRISASKSHRKKASFGTLTSTLGVSTTSAEQPSTTNERPVTSPRTPPRRLQSRDDRLHPSMFSSRTGEEGADLLMYLATSPSPAQRSGFSGTPLQGPYSQLPSSIMSTPPRSNGPFGTPLVGAPQTPSQGFNLADYVNIFTPSPAQVPWQARTPVITPARRRLNFGQAPGSEDSQSSDHNNASSGQSTTSQTSSFGPMEVGGSLIP